MSANHHGKMHWHVLLSFFRLLISLLAFHAVCIYQCLTVVDDALKNSITCLMSCRQFNQGRPGADCSGDQYTQQVPLLCGIPQCSASHLLQETHPR